MSEIKDLYFFYVMHMCLCVDLCLGVQVLKEVTAIDSPSNWSYRLV